MVEQLLKQNKILLKVAALVIEPLPNDFIFTALNDRIWEAFELGKQWQECHLSEQSTRPDKAKQDPYLEGIMKKVDDKSGG